MSEEQLAEQHSAVDTIKKHQFITFLAVSISIALFLVYIALSLYVSSGTIQLDLSRPGFAQAREEATKENQVFEGFSVDGDITEASLKEFDELYSQELRDATAIDAYGGEPLTNETLQIPNK